MKTKKMINKKQLMGHCASMADITYPNHTVLIPNLNRAKGQLQGISRMISDQRYCVDILVQFRAVMAALRNIEVSLFEAHLKHCVSTAFRSNDPKTIEAKISELSELLVRRTTL